MIFLFARWDMLVPESKFNIYILSCFLFRSDFWSIKPLFFHNFTERQLKHQAVVFPQFYGTSTTGWKTKRNLQPRKLTWIPKIVIFERTCLLKTIILGIYISIFREGMHVTSPTTSLGTQFNRPTAQVTCHHPGHSLPRWLIRTRRCECRRPVM